MKRIKVEYQLIEDKSWRQLELDPSDYFDDDESGYSINSIEKYFLEPRKYVLERMEKIQFLNFYVEDENGNRNVSKFTFWDNGLTDIQEHCQYQNQVLKYRTIINCIHLGNGNCLTLRLEEVDNQLVPITHVITDSNESTSQKVDLSAFSFFRDQKP